MALVGIAAVDRDPLGTPAALTVTAQRGFDGDGPQPGERFLLHPRFTDFTTDGVVEFLRAGGAPTHGLPASALVGVRPNVVRIGSDDGSPFALEGFRLLPPG